VQAWKLGLIAASVDRPSALAWSIAFSTRHRAVRAHGQ